VGKNILATFVRFCDRFTYTEYFQICDLDLWSFGIQTVLLIPTRCLTTDVEALVCAAYLQTYYINVIAHLQATTKDVKHSPDCDVCLFVCRHIIIYLRLPEGRHLYFVAVLLGCRQYAAVVFLSNSILLSWSSLIAPRRESIQLWTWKFTHISDLFFP